MVQATAHRQTSVRAGFATATRTETEYNLVVIVNDEPPSSTALRDGATLQTVNYLDWQETEPHAWVFFFFFLLFTHDRASVRAILPITAEKTKHAWRNTLAQRL